MNKNNVYHNNNKREEINATRIKYMGNRLILCTGDPLYLENVVVTTRYLGFQIMEVKRVRASTNI